MSQKTTTPPDGPAQHSEVERTDAIRSLTRNLLVEIGEDPNRPGLERTPDRVARAWLDLTRGYEQDIKEVVNGALFDALGSEMVLVRDIAVMSLCEHHLLPFYGRCHIAYLPKGKVLGLSKFARIVDVFARRLQIQERLTMQIADAVNEVLAPHGVGVIVEARHMCMMMRGVEKAQSLAVTSSLLGAFKDDPATRSELLSLVSRRNHS